MWVTKELLGTIDFHRMEKNHLLQMKGSEQHEKCHFWVNYPFIVSGFV